MDSNFPSMVMPLMCAEGQVNGSEQQYHQQLWNIDGLHQPDSWVEVTDPLKNRESALLPQKRDGNASQSRQNRVPNRYRSVPVEVAGDGEDVELVAAADKGRRAPAHRSRDLDLSFLVAVSVARCRLRCSSPLPSPLLIAVAVAHRHLDFSHWSVGERERLSWGG
ncbi:hypothetical protein Acr_11g0005740 [Actinidia rufa]|uniref:Uncharacterized protein n=1 Tax=Actinidia rufa TaxID=165716 RepID=A0A7J0FC80_9ERIC|nr:hypothetical protein Acr_11g0005740 [Actinidia rufa]